MDASFKRRFIQEEIKNPPYKTNISSCHQKHTRMEICVIRPDEWSSLGIAHAEWLSSAGSSGCNFTADVKGERRLLKVIFSSPKDDKSQADEALREAFIGFHLGQLPDKDIAAMFAETVQLIHLLGALPDSMANLLDGDCQAKATKDVWIIVQRFVGTPAVPMHKWLLKQTAPVGAEVIRSFLFQSVLALSYAQHQLGFQHNDIKMENVMITPNDTGAAKKKSFLLGGTDNFEFTIPAAGGFEIVFIDFGGSSIVIDDQQRLLPPFLKTGTVRTDGFTPFDCMEADDLLLARRNDADMAALFVIAMNLLANKRAALSGDLIWDYPNGYDYFSAQMPPTKAERAGDPRSDAVLERDKQLYTTAVNDYNNSAFSGLQLTKKDQRAVGRWVFLYEEMFDALGGMDYMNTVPPNLIDSLKGDAKELLRVALSKKFVQGRKKLDLNFFGPVPQLIDQVFGGQKEAELARSFFRLLFAPWQYQRRAFGLYEKPFDTYGLANALYHPFFAHYYWNNNSNGVPLQEIGQPFAQRVDVSADEERKVLVEKTKEFFKQAARDPLPEEQQPGWPMRPLRDIKLIEGKESEFIQRLMTQLWLFCFDPKTPAIPDAVPLDVLQTIATKCLDPACSVASKLFADKKAIGPLKTRFDVIEEDRLPFGFMVKKEEDEEEEGKKILAPGRSEDDKHFKFLELIEKDSGADMEDFLLNVPPVMLLLWAFSLRMEGASDSRLDVFASETKRIAAIPDGTPNYELFTQVANILSLHLDPTVDVQEESDDEKTKSNRDVASALRDVLVQLVSVLNVKEVPADMGVSVIRSQIVNPMHELASIVADEMDDATYKILVNAWPPKDPSLDIGWANAKSSTTRRQLVRETIKVNGKEVKSDKGVVDAAVTGKGYDASGENMTSELFSDLVGYTLFAFSAYLAAKGEEFPFSQQLPVEVTDAALTQKKRFRSLAAQASGYRNLLSDAGVFDELGLKPIKSAIQSIQQQLEVIESLNEFKHENSSSSSSDYNLDAIHAHLIDPLREIVQSTLIDVSLQPIFEMLGLAAGSSDLIHPPPKGLETKYFHTLSLAAQLLENQESPDELVSRIQSEWPSELIAARTATTPPPPPPKKGSVFEI